MSVRHSASSTLDAAKSKLRELRPAAHSDHAALSPSAVAEPSTAMFTGIRRRLTLWYTLALLAIWVLCGALLYAGTRQTLLGGASNTLATSAAGVAQDWVRDWQAHPGDLGGPGGPGGPCHAEYSTVPYLVCYPQVGLPQASQQAVAVPAFLDTRLAQRALNSPSGTATDTIDGGNGLGAVQRYALVVQDPNSHSVLGVVQVGVPIAGELQALDTLLELLLVFGGVALVAAWLGGYWLGGRALEPARISFTRQQAFIADAAHELRTPLTLLRADAEVLLRGRGQLNPDDAALLDDIVTESAHMGRLTTNMLTLARLDSGTLHIEREVIDLAEVARGAAQRVQAFAQQDGLRVSAEPRLPALVVGDRALLDQAALILLDNAIKYNRPGGAVTTWAEPVGDDVCLIVRDTGPGIPPEHLARLGERFYRVDKARSREAGGAGLGLSIARGIAAALGGRLELASTPGEGTTARLILPAATPTPPTPHASPV